MKPLITLVVLCTAYFVMLDAFPVFPSGFEAGKKQQLDEMAKLFLSIFNKILTAADNGAGRDGNIQADNEVRRIILNDIDNIISSLTKNITADLNDEVGQSFIKGANSIVSVIRKQLDDEGTGHTQSKDESLQTVMNFIGALLSRKTKKTANGDVQLASRNEVGLTMINAALDLFSALKRNTDPNDEVQQTTWNGAKTLISLLGKQLEEEGESQSSTSGGEMRQAFMNLIASILSGVRKPIDNGEAHSAADDFERTLLNIVKIFFAVIQRNLDLTNEVQKYINAANAIIPLLINDGKPDYDKLKTFMNQSCSLFSELTESGEIQSTDEAAGAILKLFSDILSIASKKIDPDDDEAQSFFSSLSTVVSLLGRKINSGGNQVQSDIDNELAKTVINLIDTVTSELQQGVEPEDEVAQLFLTCFKRNIMHLVVKSIGRGGQEDTLPTYTAKRFDQRVLIDSVDENAAMVEGGIALSEEAKTQLWGAILSSLASGLSNKSLHG